MGIVTRALDIHQTRIRIPGGEFHLMFWRELKTVAPGQHQGRHPDLAETIHDRPAPDCLTEPIDEGLGSELRPRPEISRCGSCNKPVWGL